MKVLETCAQRTCIIDNNNPMNQVLLVSRHYTFRFSLITFHSYRYLRKGTDVIYAAVIVLCSSSRPPAVQGSERSQDAAAFAICVPRSSPAKPQDIGRRRSLGCITKHRVLSPCIPLSVSTARCLKYFRSVSTGTYKRSNTKQLSDVTQLAP